MPHANELPASLKSLTSRNGMAVRPDPDFNNDIQRLFSGIEHLEKLLRPPSGKPALGKNNAAPITVVPIEEKIVITLAPVQPATVRAKAVERGTRRNPPKPAARQAAPKPIYPSRLGLNLLVTLLLVAMFALFSAISFFDVDLATMLGVSKAKGLQLKKEQVVVRPDPSKKANAGKPPVDQPLTVRVFSRLGPGQVLESTNITVGSAIKTIDLSEKGKTQSYVDFHLKGPGTYRYALSTKLTWNTGAVNDGSGEGQITVAEDATYNLVMDNITKTSFSVMLARLSDKLIGNLP
jgi:hypothetical protein